MIYSPCSIDPGSTFTIPRLIGIAIVVCYGKEHIDYYYLYLTRLNCFTISHYGSYSCLPTLKPHLTISAPRLANGFWLGITMLGFHQLYVKHRTGAPFLNTTITQYYIFMQYFHLQIFQTILSNILTFRFTNLKCI